MPQLAALNAALMLTPPGAAAIAVVRLRGPAVEGFLARHVSRPVAIGRCAHADIQDRGRTIDDALVARPSAEVADLNVHGGAWVVQSVLDLAGRNGFEVIARPDCPVPHDAVDADDELEREILTHLPLARTEEGIRMLLAQHDLWRELALRMERGEKSAAADLQRAMQDRCMERMLFPPVVAIIGVPNVGKSTLANQLFARERSITADLPGTTRDWVGEIANIDGLAVMLVDTPGMRAATDAIEQAAIARSDAPIRQADLIILVLDPTQPLSIGQQALIEQFPRALRVLNKVDQPAAWELAGVLPTVAARGVGCDELRRRMREELGCLQPLSTHPRCWTGRQRGVIQSCIAGHGRLADLFHKGGR